MKNLDLCCIWEPSACEWGVDLGRCAGRLRSTSDAAAVLGVAHDRMVKAMAVLAAGRPWVVLLPGSRRLSFQKAQPLPLPRPTPPRYRPPGLSRHSLLPRMHVESVGLGP